MQSEGDKHHLVETLLQPEPNWAEVFRAMQIPSSENENAELEFRKAYYKLKFDREWHYEITSIEEEHYKVMGAIMAFTKASSPADCFKTNPLTLSNSPA